MSEKLSELLGKSNCPVSFSVHMGKCSGQSWQPRSTKRLRVGSTIPLTIQWPAPDDWLARLSERLAGLLYKVGVRWRNRWGRWRLDSLETKAEVLQDDEAELCLDMQPGILSQGREGTFAEIGEDT